jgi:hypothetical protein
MMTHHSKIFFACFVAVTACTSDEEQKQDAGVEASEGPLYVIASSFITGDEIETYLVTTDSFDKSTEIDPTDGPKLLGGIDIVVHDGAVFAPDSNGPILVRYEPDARDHLVKKAELSFAGVGLSRLLGGHIFVLSDTKGYVFDPAGGTCQQV